jgi:hypothetical protein
LGTTSLNHGFGDNNSANQFAVAEPTSLERLRISHSVCSSKSLYPRDTPTYPGSVRPLRGGFSQALLEEPMCLCPIQQLSNPERKPCSFVSTDILLKECTPSKYLRQVICSSPGRGILDIVVAGHVLSSNNDLVVRISREKKRGRQPRYASPTMTGQLGDIDGSRRRTRSRQHSLSPLRDCSGSLAWIGFAVKPYLYGFFTRR